MQAQRFKALLQTSILFILPVALIPGQISAAEPVEAETVTATGETATPAAESSPGAWDKTKEVSAEAWDATKEGSARAWDKTKEVSSDAWDATKEGSAKAWDKTKEVSSDAWDATKEGSARAWDKTKGMVQGEPETGEHQEAPAAPGESP